MIKTYRGQLPHNTQDTIRLSTNDGLTGYKIKKLELIGTNPSGTNQESTFFVFSTEQDNPMATVGIDMRNPTLLAVNYYETGNSPQDFGGTSIIVDNVVINQDIFITQWESVGSNPVNYYIELEQVKLSENEATVATLKDMRAGPDTNFGP